MGSDIAASPTITADHPARRRAGWAALVLILLLAGVLRMEGLGTRSLWRDELCTWHVSRMPIGESLKWGPELTKPPLYQFALRAVTSDPQPSEFMLRLPAALCGLATVLVGFWFGVSVGGWGVGLALAGLIAFNDLQIFYSQEARPYSMLALGMVLSTMLWYRLVRTGRRALVIGYAVTVVLTMYAHYLGVLAIAAHGVWWLWRVRSEPPDNRRFAPLIALVVSGLLCVPLVVRYLLFRSSLFQGLQWIEPPTFSSSVGVLSELTFGTAWLTLALLPALCLWIAGAFGVTLRWRFRPGGPLHTGRDDVCLLLLLCILGSWGGLLVVSWLAHPAMVARYAIAASIPALLIPLIISYRVDRRAPLFVMLFFILLAAPQWSDRQVEPGLRELSAYLREHADPETEDVVLTLDATIHPGWEDSERLVFDYYPPGDLPFKELRLGPDNESATDETLQNPRGLWLIVLWADEMNILEAANRQTIPIRIGDSTPDRLLFTPYRLVHVAPLERS